ncbi:putative metal homeostasis protein [Mammaliicoccus lentus]|nr:putative metal homeostasis protein [Mammaliicoccus lentus]
MAEKTDIQTARRNLRSPNIKTRKRALKIIKNFKRAARIKNMQNNAAS